MIGSHVCERKILVNDLCDDTHRMSACVNATSGGLRTADCLRRPLVLEAVRPVDLSFLKRDPKLQQRRFETTGSPLNTLSVSWYVSFSSVVVCFDRKHSGAWAFPAASVTSASRCAKPGVFDSNNHCTDRVHQHRLLASPASLSRIVY